MSGYYDTAQVCVNGHVATPSLGQSEGSPFCDKCGAQTISKCPKCSANIRGQYYVPGVISIGFGYHPPAYCFNCGNPFPWTEGHLKAARELADEIDELSEPERKQLSESVVDLTTDNSRTELASVRYKKLLAKAGKGTASAMNQIVVAIATEAAKKLIGL